MPRKAIETVLAEAVDRFMGLPGVVGVAQGECDGSPCIRVFLAADDPGARDSLPRELAGFPVEAVVSGPFYALGEE